jgi:hypothetical protein
MLVGLFCFDVARAEPTVDVVNGGMFQASVILSSRFGVPIDFEEPPLASPELAVRQLPSGNYAPHRRHQGVRFSYPEGADVDEALAALVAAWDAADGPGSPYRVEVRGTSRRLVPTTHTLPDGRREPWTPLLDERCTLHLDPIEFGWPEHRMTQWLTAMRDTCGVSLQWTPGAINAPTDGDYFGEPIVPVWTFPEFRGSPREALDELSRIVGGGPYSVLQQIHYAPGHEARFFIQFLLVEPEDDRRLNRTPLGTEPTPELRALSLTDPPVSWDEYVRWWHEHPELRRVRELEPGSPIVIPEFPPLFAAGPPPR